MVCSRDLQRRSPGRWRWRAAGPRLLVSAGDPAAYFGRAPPPTETGSAAARASHIFHCRWILGFETRTHDFFFNATVWNAIFKRYQSSPFILRHQWDRDLRDPKKSSTQELPTEILWRRLRSLPENTPNPNPYLQSSIKTLAKTRQGTVNKKTLNLALERDFTKTCARIYPSLNSHVVLLNVPLFSGVGSRLANLPQHRLHLLEF